MLSSNGTGRLLVEFQAKHLMLKELAMMPVGARFSYMRDPNSPGSFILTFKRNKDHYVARCPGTLVGVIFEETQSAPRNRRSLR